MLIPSSLAFGCGYTTCVASDGFSTTIPRWRFTMSFNLTVDILSISGRRYIAGWTMTRFCNSDRCICMNISTLRSIREGDWKSNRRLHTALINTLECTSSIQSTAVSKNTKTIYRYLTQTMSETSLQVFLTTQQFTKVYENTFQMS